jgi:hypothetical protein
VRKLSFLCLREARMLNPRRLHTVITAKGISGSLREIHSSERR